MMDELLANIERQLSGFQILDDAYSQPQKHLPKPTAAFVSMIKINGKPILPPVMTRQRRHEMGQLRSAAIKREQELASQRQLRLLDKVQTIVNSFEERRSFSQASEDHPIPIEPDSDSSTRSVHSLDLTNLSNTSTASVKHPTSVEQLGPSTKLSRSPSPDDEIPQRTNPIGEVASAQGSTSSSSDASLLNQTVIAMSDFSKSPTDLENSSGARVGVETDLVSKDESSATSKLRDLSAVGVNIDPKVIVSDLLSLSRNDSSISNTSTLTPARQSAEKVPCSGQDMSIGISTHAFGSSLPGAISGVKLACSWSRETEESKSSHDSDGENPAATGLHFMPSLRDFTHDEDDLESFGERDSYLSLLGEYSSLPMPSGSHFFTDVSEVPSSTPLDNLDPNLEEKSLNSSKASPYEKFDRSPSSESSQREEDLSMFISTGSNLFTNTLSQSCTLPSALRTISAASTLQDVEDPWNNTLVETPQPSGEFHSDTVRGTPVGQEDSETNLTTATKTSQHNQTSPESINSENEFSSPEKRVRRNSYTLEHPSPALLDAQARNDAPHASLGDKEKKPSVRRSFELTKDNDTESVDCKESKLGKEVTESGFQKMDQYKELPEENVLRHQLQYFEEMQQHLEQQQRQQLQQLLNEQQQAQIALQQEMAELEKRFLQKQGSLHMQEMIGAGKEVVGNAHPVITPSPTSVKSGNQFPTLNSLQCTPSPDIPSKHTSPSVISKTSPTVKSASTVANGGAVEPFYLGGDHSRHVTGGAASPVSARSPAVGENIMIGSPYNKFQIINSPTMRAMFDRVSAAVKGYLTRRIFKTNKVQSTIKTIKDSVAFADKFISETPIKQGVMSMQDMVLAERVLAQVRAAQYNLYDIFFTLSAAQRMDLIAQSRKLDMDGGQKSRVPKQQDAAPMRPLSAATVKALERKKKAKAAEARMFGDNKFAAGAPSRGRPRSAAEGRILKPLLSQVSPARPASTNTYRPSKYGIVIQHEPPKAKDPKKLTQEPGRSKVTSQRAPGNSTQGVRSVKTRSPVTVKTKGVRRSLYPIANPSSKKTTRRTTDIKK